MRKRTALGITISKVIGICIFLIVLAVLNSLELSGIGLAVVQYLNMSLLSIIMFSILLYLGELFSIFPLPLNLPYPIFNAFGGVMLVNFLFGLLDVIVIIPFFTLIEPLVAIVVFVLALVVGYVRILVGPKKTRKKIPTQSSGKERKRKKGKHSWEDVGDEFREAMYNLGKSLKKAFK